MYGFMFFLDNDIVNIINKKKYYFIKLLFFIKEIIN